MAGTVTLSSDNTYPKSTMHTGEKYKSVREVTFACVGDHSNGTIPDTNLCNVAGLEKDPLAGWGLWAVELVPGATGPTGNSDVYLKSADGTDFLSGNGVDALDAATNSFVLPSASVIFIGGTLTLSVANQSVNDALYKVKLYLVR